MTGLSLLERDPGCHGQGSSMRSLGYAVLKRRGSKIYVTSLVADNIKGPRGTPTGLRI